MYSDCFYEAKENENSKYMWNLLWAADIEHLTIIGSCIETTGAVFWNPLKKISL